MSKPYSAPTRIGNYFEDLQLEEVARAMEVSLATVKRYLKSALETLRSLLDLSEAAVEQQAAAAYREN